VLVPAPLRLGRFELSLVWHVRRDLDPALTWLRGAIGKVARSLSRASDSKAP
jgi:uncharacterized protein YbjT (DUF2867 family)